MSKEVDDKVDDILHGFIKKLEDKNKSDVESILKNFSFISHECRKKSDKFISKLKSLNRIFTFLVGYLASNIVVIFFNIFIIQNDMISYFTFINSCFGLTLILILDVICRKIRKKAKKTLDESEKELTEFIESI